MMKKTLMALTVALAANTAFAQDVTLVVKEQGAKEYTEITIDASQVDQIKTSQRYEFVEEQVWVSMPQNGPSDFARSQYVRKPQAMSKDMVMAQSLSEPNDPDYSWMYYFHDQSETNKGSSEINAAMNASVQNKRLRVAVIDGGFNEHEDIPWNTAEGHNFYQAGTEVINSEWRSYDDPDMCETGHGNAIGGVIGATSNNGIGISGVLDADLIPVRAFKCNMARLNDVADAIRYAAGDQVGDAPKIEPVDIVNLSMGGEADSCPTYLQEAINFANEQGTLVYVAAGNQSIDVNGIVPAMCDGVVVVGATNQQRVKASFSNYGSLVDFMVPGYDIYTYNLDGSRGWWEGTSFATPLAVGIHGLALQHNPNLSHDEIVSFMKATAQPMSTDVASASEDCSGDRCGAGLVNASNLMSYVAAISDGESFTIRHALSEESTCDQALFVSVLGTPARLCEMHEVVINSDGTSLVNNVRLVRVAKGAALTEANAELVIEIPETIFLVDGIDSEAFDYGVQICTTEECNDTPIIEIEVDTTTPAICD